MDPKKIFKNALMVIGGLLLIVAVAMIATYRAQPEGGQANITGGFKMWGTLPQDAVIEYLSGVREVYRDVTIGYTEVKQEEFAEKLTDAIASGNAPDMVLLETADVISYRNRLLPIPFTSFPESTYHNTFVDATKSFILPWGVVGFPIGVDPLILYYNRDLLAGAYITEPARTWTELLEHAEKLSVRVSENENRIEQSAIPMGSWNNIPHAQAIIESLAFQQGNPLVMYLVHKGQFETTIRGVPGADQSADTGIGAPINFFASFSNPLVKNYSWNSAFVDAQSAYLSEQAVYYIGYASEYNTLRLKNPNLNIGVSLLPQTSDKSNTLKKTSAKVYGIGIVKLSPRISDSVIVANSMTSSALANLFITKNTIASARRDVLSSKQSDPRLDVIYKSAIIADSWWNPNKKSTNEAFALAFRILQSGSGDISDSLRTIEQSLTKTLGTVKPPQSPTGETDS